MDYNLPLKLFYCKIKNFGDQLNQDLFHYYGFDVRHHSSDQAEAVAIGSILEMLSYQFSGIVLGSGFMFESSSSCFPSASIFGVRGNLTKKAVFATGSVTVGDPGLLTPNFCTESKKIYALGIVPHYVDAEDERLALLSKAESRNVLLVDVTRNPRQVVADITRCNVIASSSLHGLVIADAFGIPSIWIKLSNKVAGEGFKFKDYYSAFDEMPRCIEGQDLNSISLIEKNARKRSSKIKEIQEKLDLMFKKMPNFLEKHREMQQNYFFSKYHYFSRKLYAKLAR